jgi:hypothetical protein
VYCIYFPKLYSDQDVKISFSLIKGFPTEEALREYFVRTCVESFIALDFDEKIQYVKKILKLNYEDIWVLRDKELIYDIYQIRNKIVHSDNSVEISDEEFYIYINYLCSLVFKLSAYSQKKYGIQFEWISDTNLHFMIAEHPAGHSMHTP